VIKLIFDYKGEIDDRKYLVKWEGAAELSWIHEQDIFSKKIIVEYWAVFHAEKDGDWRVKSDHSGSGFREDVNNLLTSFVNVIC
jgi:hypothetical protein